MACSENGSGPCSDARASPALGRGPSAAASARRERLSRNEAYSVRELVTVAPVTTRVRGIPTEVPLGSEDGLPRACAANLDTLTVIPRRSLARRIGPLGPEKLAAVEHALLFALGMTHWLR
ncbi:MAG TPA: type II toxin-antitoxin system PemK/MazF family toxin [Dongiaceae bacterium]|nr:type II toxin-antitoxin system PemK/MazF family toxin [Dongiaceae bacterium]